MASAAFYLLFCTNALVALFYPWIGITVAYFITLLTPQTIWWWVFQGWRPSLWVTLPTMAGFAIAVVARTLDYSGFNTRLNKSVLLLWACFTLSYYTGPYVDVVNAFRFYDPAFVFSNLQKTYLAYFIGALLISEQKRLKFFCIPILVTSAYMTYWANAQYFLYHKFGRLHGPITPDGLGIYSDENNFAVLFIVGAPFLYYFGRYLGKSPWKWAVWAIIPFSWHAVFLTASRGALLGIMATLAILVLRLEKRAVGVAFVILFACAFAWQAGDVMRSRTATITGYKEETSANSRIEAWEAATGMMLAHPLTGVGVASFGQAFPSFSDKEPRIAHNTFFQIGGEWGVVAAATYLFLFFSSINRLRKNGNAMRKLNLRGDDRLLYFLTEACLLALIGFFVCATFLSMQGYEVLYYLLAVANSTLMLGSRLLVDRSGQPAQAKLEAAPARKSRAMEYGGISLRNEQ
jgi:O-antigen ligase